PRRYSTATRDLDNERRGFLYGWNEINAHRRMTLTVWRQRTAGHRPLATVAALLTTFAGVALLIDRPKGSILERLALRFLAVRGALFAWAVWPHAATPTSVPSSLCSKFLRR